MAGPPGYTRINNTDLETQQESNSYELHDIHDIEYPPKNTDLASQPESNFSLFKLSKAAQTNSQVKIFGRDDIFLFEFDPSDGFEKLREYIAFKLSELNLEEEYLNFQIGYISTTLIHVSTDYDLGGVYPQFRFSLIVYRECDIGDIDESIHRRKLKSSLCIYLALLALLIPVILCIAFLLLVATA